MTPQLLEYIIAVDKCSNLKLFRSPETHGDDFREAERNVLKLLKLQRSRRLQAIRDSAKSTPATLNFVAVHSRPVQKVLTLANPSCTNDRWRSGLNTTTDNSK